MIKNQSSSHKADYDQLNKIRCLISKINRNRNIVPLLGAGISVEAGIPTLDELRRYLSKVQHYLFNHLYRPQTWEYTKIPERSDHVEPAVLHYLDHFGWPDPYQLESELWHWLDVEDSAREDPTASHPSPPLYAEEIRNHYGNKLRPRLDWLVKKEILESFRFLENDLVKEIADQINDAPPADFSTKNQSAGWHLLHQLHGDWQLQLSRLTRSSPDHADTLFRMFMLRRQPATAHRYLAFLTPILHLKLFLTTNFDSLLEESLRTEGFSPNLYEIAIGAPLPHHSLIHEDISVIKLHGGKFGLRVDASLDAPLDKEAKERLRKYLPENPILLVLGLSGWDQRVLDIVEIVRQVGGEIFWVRFEKDRPKPVELRFGKDPQDLTHLRFRDPGAFLKELYHNLTDTHAPSRRPYLAYAERPTLPPRAIFSTDGTLMDTKLHPQYQSEQQNGEKSIYLFLDEASSSRNWADHIESEASYKLAHLVATKSATHKPIWIDLESKFTVNDIVGDLFTQLRRYDPQLPPANSTIEHSENTRTLHKLCRALNRGKYLIAFDGAGAFGRPPTAHHGLPNQHIRYMKNIKQSIQFLYDLFRLSHHKSDFSKHPPPRDFDDSKTKDPYHYIGRLKSSIIAFAITTHSTRSSNDTPPKHITLWEKIKNSGSPSLKTISKRSPNRINPDAKIIELLKDYPHTWHLLSTFRRRRSTIALRNLLPTYIAMDIRSNSRQKQSIEDHITTFLSQSSYPTGPMLRVEGGYYWLNRSIRDSLYDHSRKGKLAKEDLAKLTPHNNPETVTNLLLKGGIHIDISDHYIDLYRSAHETSALFEYLYHRISGLRYLTKLDAWITRAENNQPISEDNAIINNINKRFKGYTGLKGYFKEGLLSSNGRFSKKKSKRLRELRLFLIRSLRGTLAKEKGRLLSNTPNATLSTWIRWVREEDCKRFKIATYPLLGEKSPRKVLRCELEKSITKECTSFGTILDNLEAEAYSDRMDLRDLLSLYLSSPELKNAPEITTGATNDLRVIFFEKLEHLLLTSPCYKYFEMYHRAATLHLRLAPNKTHQLEQHANIMHKAISAWEKDQSANLSDLEKSKIHCLAYEADRRIFRENIWDLKGQNADLEKIKKEASATIRSCDEALQHLDWMHNPSPVHRAYFHSLRGRALALKGLNFYNDAQRDFDLARGIVHRNRSGEPRERRQEFAIAQLRIAEFLMFKTDENILDWCQKLTNRKATKKYRCLSRWPTKDLHTLPKKSSNLYHKLLRASAAQLANAKDQIDLAEHILEFGRHDSEWWSHLYQLRTQLQIEKLLLIISGSDHKIKTSPLSTFEIQLETPQNRESLKRRQTIGRFIRLIREGLRAIRYGLDIVLPEKRRLSSHERDEIRGDRRLQYFFRLWIELWICGAVLTRMTEKPAAGGNRISDETLWSRWARLNQIEGLWKLPKSKEILNWWKNAFTSEASEHISLEWLHRRSDKSSHSTNAFCLATRGDTLKLINSALSYRAPNLRDELFEIVIGKNQGTSNQKEPPE